MPIYIMHVCVRIKVYNIVSTFVYVYKIIAPHTIVKITLSQNTVIIFKKKVNCIFVHYLLQIAKVAFIFLHN